MTITLTKIKAIASISILAVVLFGVWYLTAEYKDNKWQGRFDSYKVELAEKHTENITIVLNQEREARREADKLEVKYHEAKSALDNVTADNIRLATELGGLRDKGASNTNRVGKSKTTTTSNTSNTSTGNKLSAEATGFLLEFARNADQAALYANICYQYIQTLNKQEKPNVQDSQTAK